MEAIDHFKREGNEMFIIEKCVLYQEYLMHELKIHDFAMLLKMF